MRLCIVDQDDRMINKVRNSILNYFKVELTKAQKDGLWELDKQIYSVFGFSINKKSERTIDIPSKDK